MDTCAQYFFVILILLFYTLLVIPSSFLEELKLLQPPLSHTSKTLFLHSAVRLRASETKGEELIVIKFIPAGTVLIAEIPLIVRLDLKSKLNFEAEPFAIISALVNDMARIQENGTEEEITIFSKLCSHPTTFDFAFLEKHGIRLSPSDKQNLIKYRINSMFCGLHAVSSKLNHGYPTTVDVLGITSDNISESRADYRFPNAIIVIAIDDLQPGTALEIDYFQFWNPDYSLEDIIELADVGKIELFNNLPFTQNSNLVLYKKIKSEKQTRIIIEEGLALEIFPLFYGNNWQMAWIKYLEIESKNKGTKYADPKIKFKSLLDSVDPEKRDKIGNMMNHYLDYFRVLQGIKCPAQSREWMGEEFLRKVHSLHAYVK